MRPRCISTGKKPWTSRLLTGKPCLSTSIIWAATDGSWSALRRQKGNEKERRRSSITTGSSGQWNRRWFGKCCLRNKESAVEEISVSVTPETVSSINSLNSLRLVISSFLPASELLMLLCFKAITSVLWVLLS